MISATEAIQRLITGNQRFIPKNGMLPITDKSHVYQESQSPFAIIVGCSDSRVPAEIIFDQGFGDLFVIRVAGNVIAPSQIGSVEFAVSQFKTPLVVVMGHTQCGAIAATIEQLNRHVANRSKGLQSIVDRIKPSVAPLMETELRHNKQELMNRAVCANIDAAVNKLKYSSPLLEPLIQNGELAIVGANYSIETGAVDFYNLPRSIKLAI